TLLVQALITMPKKKQAHSDSRFNVDKMVCDLKQRWDQLSGEERAGMDTQLDDAYPGGFNARDEANALIAIAVRNGPIENLHAGKRSSLLEDPSLSRITDDEMKMLMICATEVLAGMLRFREQEPELYRWWARTYGGTYCRRWKREPNH